MATVGSVRGLTSQAPVASRRHTARLAGILLGLGVAGMLLQGAGADARPNRVVLYGSLIVAEWVLFRAVVAGLRTAGGGWRALVGRVSPGWRGWASDIALGALVCASWVALVAHPWLAANPPVNASPFLPSGALERVLWLLVSASAGFCEEMTFRGYFQTQFEAATSSRGAAMVLQAGLFGLVHAYQGTQAALAIVAYGLALAALARWRRGLRAGMIAHTLSDVIIGLGVVTG